MSVPKIRVWMLGTGGPELSPHRQGAATLVEAGGHRLLIDAGRGVLQRLYECRLDIGSVHRVFLTHLHSDHIEGLPGLWMTGWFIAGRTRPLQVHGPRGTQAMVNGMKAMYGHDIACRGGPSAKSNIEQVEVAEFDEGVVFTDGAVTVTAFTVEHCDGNPAVGFRVDCEGSSVVISGDTIYTDSLVRHARGCDVLIHNVIAASDEYLQRFPTKQRVLAKLASPEECARAFIETGARAAVFTHVILLGSTEAELMQRTRAMGYAGPLIIAQDRVRIDIGDTITVVDPEPTESLPDLTCPQESSQHEHEALAPERLFSRLLA